MKTLKILLIICLSGNLLSNTLFAQAPQSFNYQAVARNASGAIISNQAVSFRISLLQGSVTGASSYTETHAVTTDPNGLVNFAIGNGTVVSGTFASINWASGPYYVKVELDASGGTAFVVMSTTQLLSVPYAQYAQHSGNLNVFTYTRAFQGNNIDLLNGHTQLATFNLNYICGDPEAISFSNSALPAGLTITHANAGNVLDFTDTLIITAGDSVVPGTYSIILTATSASGTKATQKINVRINPILAFEGTYVHYDSLFIGLTPFAINGPFTSIVSPVVSNQFTITNFGQNGVTIAATVTSSNTTQVLFTVPSQTVSGCTYSGSGGFSLYQGTIYRSVQYVKTCGSAQYNCRWNY